ncbi:GNAT family N-acetyltransferase [Uliginosibacterium flavum]|uniref:GNAT family N-acetyltransferase n=1 Tax=Uliginosibacterium flavum TaxID=1396831 RepID=A0ABV2TIE6_9RHOO
MSIKFRPAQLGDIPAIAALLANLFAIEQDFTPDPARQLAGLKLMLPREDILMWVAEEMLEEESKIVGFCSVQTLISTAEGSVVGLIEDVVVPVEWRGAGIGRQLLEGAEAWARRRGCSRLQLLADEGNLPALAFYERQGWQRTSLHNWRRMLRD